MAQLPNIFPQIDTIKAESLLRQASLLTLIAASLMILLSILHHAMWLDELQPWALLKASPDLNSFMTHIKFEGHPVLWFGIVKLVQIFTDNFQALQIIHAAIAISSLYLIWRYAPLEHLEKIFVTLSFPFAFQYAVITRSYALGIMLIIAGLIFARRAESPMRWLFWGLAANTAFLLGLVAGALGLSDLLRDPKKAWHEKYYVLGAVFLGLMAVVMAIPHREFQPAFPFTPETLMSFTGMHSFMVRLAHSFGWSPGFLSPLSQMPTSTADIIFAYLAVIFMITALSQHWRLLLSFGLLIAAFITIHFYFYPLAFYHFMLLQLAVIFLIWQERPITNNLAQTAFMIFLLPSVMMTINVTVDSIYTPYSQSKNTAEWITEKNLEDEFWIAATDYEAAPVFTYLNRPVYFPQCNCDGPYIQWDVRRRPIIQFHDVLNATDRKMREGNLDHAYLLLSGRQPWYMRFETTDLLLQQIKTFRHSEMPGEQYSIYKVTRRTADAMELLQF